MMVLRWVGLSELLSSPSVNDSLALPLASLSLGADRDRRMVQMLRDVVLLLIQANAEDWLVTNPRTLSWFVRVLSQRSGNSLGRCRFWRFTLGLWDQG